MSSTNCLSCTVSAEIVGIFVSDYPRTKYATSNSKSIKEHKMHQQFSNSEKEEVAAGAAMPA